ncbi:MAG: cbb3-type cytochrome c oxidase subunit 3 [Zoogloeaceae bacterium]|jgi:cytochrome c oxidase cbb3-type subunit 4|nr:cbb3-type cytochrome c oxidase subunit 3 [Zoogloeaceae bacterium]
MDITLSDLRSLLTPLVGIVLFLMVVKWAYGEKSRKGYEEAANLPFTDDEDEEKPGSDARPR